MLNNQYFLLITLLPTYLDTSTLKRDNYEVTIYFIWTNLLKQKKWSLAAPSGGSVEYTLTLKHRERYRRDMYHAS